MTAVKPGKIFFERVVRCKYNDAQHQSNLPPAKFVTALEKEGWTNKGNVWVCPNDHMHTTPTANLDNLFLGVIHVRAVVQCAMDDGHEQHSAWIVAGGRENAKPLENLLARLGWYQRMGFWLHPAHKAARVIKKGRGE